MFNSIDELVDDIKLVLFQLDYKNFVCGFCVVVDSTEMTYYILDREDVPPLKPLKGEYWICINGLDSVWKTKDSLNDILCWYKENY